MPCVFPSHRRAQCLTLLAFVLAACQPRQPVQQPAPEERTGTFQFRVQGPEEIAGVVHVMSDTITVEPGSGLCMLDQTGNRLRAMRFECRGMGRRELVGDVVLSFDLLHPTTESQWTSQVRRQKASGTRCAEYTTDAQGRRTCVRTEPVMVETESSVGGKLLLTRHRSLP